MAPINLISVSVYIEPSASILSVVSNWNDTSRELLGNSVLKGNFSIWIHSTLYMGHMLLHHRSDCPQAGSGKQGHSLTTGHTLIQWCQNSVLDCQRIYVSWYLWYFMQDLCTATGSIWFYLQKKFKNWQRWRRATATAPQVSLIFQEH